MLINKRLFITYNKYGNDNRNPFFYAARARKGLAQGLRNMNWLFLPWIVLGGLIVGTCWRTRFRWAALEAVFGFSLLIATTQMVDAMKFAVRPFGWPILFAAAPEMATLFIMIWVKKAWLRGVVYSVFGVLVWLFTRGWGSDYVDFLNGGLMLAAAGVIIGLIAWRKS